MEGQLILVESFFSLVCKLLMSVVVIMQEVLVDECRGYNVRCFQVKFLFS